MFLSRFVSQKLQHERNQWTQILTKGGILSFPATLGRFQEIGAVAESSGHLAKRMISGIDFNGPGLIVELGPGLGAITRAIVQSAPNPSHVLLLEVGGEFIPVLKKRFPCVKIRHDSAERLVRYVNGHKVNAIVSSLPLRSLPHRILKKTGKALMQVMDNDTLYIQFTYDLRPNRNAYFPAVNMKKIHSKIVWRNLPPARVDIFRRVPNS